VPKVTKPHKHYAVVSVAAGGGIKETFLSLGCDCVVDGGQSMNPSAEDFLDAFKSLNADVIFVFPNNSNIILTANQAAQLYSEADVRVINSKTIGEGYAAISMMDTSSNDTAAIISSLDEIISGVVTGSVSKAIRSTELDGIKVIKDDYIGFAGNKIYTDSPNLNTAALELLSALEVKNYDILLVVCGQDAAKEETDELYKQLKADYRRLEIVMIDGGQPVYDYILILE
jgi:dihydroxyacetone kinase-like predicted kinase